MQMTEITSAGFLRTRRHDRQSKSGRFLALGVAGVLCGVSIGFSAQYWRGSSVPEQRIEAQSPPPPDVRPPSAQTVPAISLVGVVRGASPERAYALLSVSGQAPREVRIGQEVVAGVQLVEVRETDVTFVAQGRSIRVSLPAPVSRTPPEPPLQKRSKADWRGASDATVPAQPASPQPALIAPASGFERSSSSATDRAVWRASQGSQQ